MKLKLQKLKSYSGTVRATQKSPYVTVDAKRQWIVRTYQRRTQHSIQQIIFAGIPRRKSEE